MTSETATTDKITYDPLNPKVTDHPYPHYAQLREIAPVHYVESMNGYVISRWDDVMAVLQDGQTFSSAQFWPELLGEYDPVPEVAPMISLDPPGHVRIRRLANKAFVPGKVNKMGEKIRRVANELIDDIIERHGSEGEFDFVWEFTALFPVTVIADVLGVDLAQREDFKHWVDALLSAGNRAAYNQDQLAVIAEASKDIRAYFERVFDERSANPGEDLISGFIQAEVDGQRLTRSEVLNMAILLLIGGVETTTNLLGISFTHMKRIGGIQERLRADPELIGPFVEEMLRYDGPVQMLFRHTTCAVEMHGVTIPENTLVMPLLGAANHDERKYENAEQFDLERKPKEMMSFGQGPHFCLGFYLSRMEARLAIETLLERFEVLEPLTGEPKWMESYFARGPKGLPVRFKTRA